MTRAAKPKPVKVNRAALARVIEQTVNATPVYDIHTHLYDPAFGPLLLWGIDEMLVYHYLVAEAFRYLDMPYDKFWELSKRQQADLIWDALFTKHSPVSEACRGVLTTLQRLGLDVKKRDLPAARRFFAKWKADDYITHCMELANVRAICMTNSPFDDEERPLWERGFRRDGRFRAALRIDPLLMDWSNAGALLAKWGYEVAPDIGPHTLSEVRRFLAEWTKRMSPLYAMVSLPPSFDFPEDTARARLIEHAVLPHCREHGIPFAMMIGVKKLVNPHLRLAGDSVGKANIDVLERILTAFPDNKFLVTMLSRENQHELCVVARKFRNLHVFGCWWFTNNPSIIDEMTRMRLELIGLSVTPQHSDARVLDQIIYKWEHSRRIIAEVLTDKYTDLAATGWVPAPREIERDVKYLFGGAFEEFLQK
jgi:hypothetical protein